MAHVKVVRHGARFSPRESRRKSWEQELEYGLSFLKFKFLIGGFYNKDVEQIIFALELVDVFTDCAVVGVGRLGNGDQSKVGFGIRASRWWRKENGFCSSDALTDQIENLLTAFLFLWCWAEHLGEIWRSGWDSNPRYG